LSGGLSSQKRAGLAGPDRPIRPVVKSATELIRGLQDTIEGTLGPLLKGQSACALLDFPDYTNVGDSAIWAGEVQYLRSHGIRIVYRCDFRHYSRERLHRALKGGGILLLQGGGNLGDLYPQHQDFRERVVEDFPESSIVVLPQTIYFRGADALAKARGAFDAHRDLTLLVRDQRSLEFARNEFRATSLLCPDMAFMLGPLARPQGPDLDVLWLWRNDTESAGWAPVGQQVARLDWLDEPPAPLGRLVEHLEPLRGFYPDRLRFLLRVLRRAREVLARKHDAQARKRVARGCRLLSRGHIVVTDRLHGHILSLLLGIPHVLLDNSYGKVKSFYDTWMADSNLVRWASSPHDVADQVERLRRGGA
jgi:exopolysaccharide biosynthesis predicted pyruvyltransferase EpsI